MRQTYMNLKDWEKERERKWGFFFVCFLQAEIVITWFKKTDEHWRNQMTINNFFFFFWCLKIIPVDCDICLPNNLTLLRVWDSREGKMMIELILFNFFLICRQTVFYVRMLFVPIFLFEPSQIFSPQLFDICIFLIWTILIVNPQVI